MLFSAALFVVSAAAAPSLDIAAARRSMLGRWEGKLEYRDYQENRWFGLPVKVEVRDGGDGVTLIRTADYDDGPSTGNVRITTVSMLTPDGAAETSATFRKGRSVELNTAKLSLQASASEPQHWTLVELIEGRDDDRPAIIRYTTVRDSDWAVTTKEVDFADDAASAWLLRNRTTLSRVRD